MTRIVSVDQHFLPCGGEPDLASALGEVDVRHLKLWSGSRCYCCHDQSHQEENYCDCFPCGFYFSRLTGDLFGVEKERSIVFKELLPARTAAETNRALLGLMARHPGRMRTITADNGTEFHWYGQVEALSPVKFYFATPHHSWERGTNENTNGLIRQYLPKGATMDRITQNDCDSIAEHLNNRPRKRHGYKTPNQCFLQT